MTSNTIEQPHKVTVKDLTLEEKASLTSGSDFWHLDGIDAKHAVFNHRP